MSRRVASAWALAALWLLVAGAPSAAQSPGLNAPVAVGPFLNGVFPSRAPRDPASVQWVVAPAFPNLPLPAPLVIVTNPVDQRLYVGSRDGRVVSFENQPNVTTTAPFLDLRDRVAVVSDGGFLGMAFHPQFGTPGAPHRGQVYVYYSSYCPIDASRQVVDLTACNPNYPTGPATGFFDVWLRLSRFTVADGDSVPDPASERVMLNIRLYNSSHRGGGMVFADDGTLWLTIGDQFRYTTAQDIVDTLEGGVMRLAMDVTENGDGSLSCPPGSHAPVRAFGRPDPLHPTVPLGQPDEVSGQLYCIPDDNPWLSPAGANFEEYATVGHRNPHRLTKDSATGRLWVGEVGQSTREEVNVLQLGHNYGWPYREGTIAGPTTMPPGPLLGGALTEPVIDFGRTDAVAIIGGYVYNGTRFPELKGRYLAGDYITRKIWAITLDESSMKATAAEIARFDPGSLGTFGQDKNGEVYLASVGSTKPLYTLERVTSAIPDPPPLLSQLGAFTALTPLTAASFFVPYGLNEPFWSDGARKSRWIAVPNDGRRDTSAEQVTYTPDADWQFPNGTVAMKHFELPTDESNASQTARLETRFLVRGDDARWYGLTYRWLADQSDAELLTTGATADYGVHLANGGTRVQSWLFPSRTECLSCHNAGTSGVLGLRTHQLNGDFRYPSSGRTDNQLATWTHLGMLAPAPDVGALATLPRGRAHRDPTASLEDRARTWLDANCSHCHRPGTGNRAVFDARLTTPLAKQGLVYGGVIDDLGIPGACLVTPGSPPLSIVSHRAGTAGTPFAMPPLAKARVDTDGVEVLDACIQRIDPSFPRNGVAFEYYEEAAIGVLPNFAALTPKATGIAPTFDISSRRRADDFAFRFRGVIQIDVAGDYTFYTSSDDGSRLYLDGALLVDNDGQHGTQERSGLASLTAGFHNIETTFFQRAGSAVLSVKFQGPGRAKQLIPTDLLFPVVPALPVNGTPTLTSPGAQTSVVGAPVNLTLAAMDPDNDELWFEASGLPPGVVIAHATGVITGAATLSGVYAVTVGVSDGPAVDSKTFQWTVQTSANTLTVTSSPSPTATPARTPTLTPVPGAVQVSVPDSLLSSGEPGSLAVLVTAASNVQSFHLQIDYDPALLTIGGVGKTALSEACTLVSDLGMPGRVVADVTCAAPLLGGGALIQLAASSSAVCGSLTDVSIGACTLDGGAAACQAIAGHLRIACGLSGRVVYYSNSQPVSGVRMDLEAAATSSVSSGGDGAYGFSDASAGMSKLTPHKTGEVNGAVTAFDATVILQGIVGLRPLTSMQRLAADVSGNGALTAFDAALILRYRVGLIASLPVAGNCGSAWAFVPTPPDTAERQSVAPQPDFVPCRAGAIQYAALTAPAAQQDFLGIVFGDPSGNWQATGGGGGVQLSDESVAAVQLGGGARSRRQRLMRLPLNVEPGVELNALDLAIEYDPSQVARLRVRRGPQAGAAVLAVNRRQAGRISIALASATPLPAGTALWVDVLPVGPWLKADALRLIGIAPHAPPSPGAR